jgi:hypothetical protein
MVAAAEAYAARMAGLWTHHVERQKRVIRARFMALPRNAVAITVTEQNRAQWEACSQMIEAGELVLIREERRETRRGPPRPDGTRRVRKERRVSLADFDPVTKTDTSDGVPSFDPGESRPARRSLRLVPSVQEDDDDRI